MAHVDTPWIGLGALVLMFAIPFLPSWLFEGPRVVRHWPRRHICALCSASWHDGHDCEAAASAGPRPLRGRLERMPARPTVRSRTALPARRDSF
jgi:hypothetical protein